MGGKTIDFITYATALTLTPCPAHSTAKYLAGGGQGRFVRCMSERVGGGDGRQASV